VTSRSQGSERNKALKGSNPKSVSHLKMVAGRAEDEIPEGVRNAEREWRWTWNVTASSPTPHAANAERDEKSMGGALQTTDSREPERGRQFPEGSLKKSPSSRKWSIGLARFRTTRG
jgi:hypothetical protein